MRIVFMGTPFFAVGALEALISAGHELVSVYTREDTPKNRGMKLMPPPVKVCALSHNIPVFQPKGLKKREVFDMLSAQKPDVIVVAAYGKILPKAVLALPKYGCINIHASLLPKYRGASPINAAILNGEKKSGVTIIQMDEGIDTGDMLYMLETEIAANETYSELHDELTKLGAAAITAVLELVTQNKLLPIKQPDIGSSYAHMIEKDDLKISFDASADTIACTIRAYDSEPGAFGFLNGEKIKLFGAETITADGSHEVGAIIKCDKHGAVIRCNDGAVLIKTVQGAGGKKMPADAYFRGHQAMLHGLFQ